MRAPFDYVNFFALNRRAVLLVNLFCWFYQFAEKTRKSVKLSRGYGAQKFFRSCAVTRFSGIFERKLV